MVVLHFREAFRTAPPSRVELHGCGMEWVPSALRKELSEGRAQRVVVHGATSDWQFHRAVPQGCSIGLTQTLGGSFDKMVAAAEQFQVTDWQPGEGQNSGSLWQF